MATQGFFYEAERVMFDLLFTKMKTSKILLQKMKLQLQIHFKLEFFKYEK